MPESPVGRVEHYYPKVQAAAVRLSKRVKVGDKVHIVGHGDDVREKVTSLQIDHRPIQEGAPGQSVGLWVKDRVHAGDEVFLVTPEPAWSKPKADAKPADAKPQAQAKPKASKAKAKAKPARAARKAPKRKPMARRKTARRPARKASHKKR